MEFTAANVEIVVTEFYRSGSYHQHNDWLTRCQLCPEAWSFGWELINPTKNPEVQFFGANTIATKVSKCLHEIPEAQIPELRQKLLSMLSLYAQQGPKIVLTRLCVAVASLVNQTLPARWPQSIANLITLFQTEMESKGLAYLNVLLELLTIIPEEFATTSMLQTRRNEVRNHLSSDLNLVLDLLNKVFGQPNMESETMLHSIKCLQSWVQFGVPNENVEPLFDRLMTKLHDDELFDSSLDAMCSIVSHPNTHKHPNTMKRILSRIMQLQPMLHKLIEEESFEMAMPLATLFITYGESHSRMLLDWTVESTEGAQVVLGLITTIFAVSSCPAQFPLQETISEMPFGFWYIFQDDIIACEPQQYQQCVTTFGGVYHKLVEALLKKSMYPLNETGWTQDQKESFRCYRTDIADTIMYCFNILRDNLLHQLLGHLDQAITKCHENNATNWPYLEACLYAWSAIGESLADEEDCDLLPQFLAKLPMIPYNNNVKVISSTLDCIGGFSEWLSSFPHLITHVIPIVTSALSSPELSLCSTMALKDMARDCTDGLKPFAKDILEACHSAMSSNQLKTGELIRLMYPVGKMLATVPRDQVMNYLQPILMPHLMELNTLSTQDVNPVARGKVICILKMLTTLFQALDSNNKDEDEKAEAQQQQMAQLNPAVVLFPQILPLIKTLSFKWIGDEDVMDAIWNFTKQSTSSLGQNLKTYAGEIMELMLQCYSVEPNGTALELARLLLVILGKQQDCRPMLTQLFVTISTKTLSYIQSKGTPSDHADLLATFFQVMATVMKRDAKMFDPSFVDIQALVQCANFCLTMPELGPAKYSSTFLANFITVSSDSQHLASIVNSMGETVFRQTILQIGGAESSNRTFVDYYVDILLAFNKKYFDNLCGWLNGLVAENGFPTDKISRDQKEHYSRQILRERANKRKLLEILREFSMACNGLIVSEDMNRVMATWDRIGDKNADKAEAAAAAAAAAAASGGAQASIAAAPPR